MQDRLAGTLQTLHEQRTAIVVADIAASGEEEGGGLPADRRCIIWCIDGPHVCVYVLFETMHADI